MSSQLSSFHNEKDFKNLFPENMIDEIQSFSSIFWIKFQDRLKKNEIIPESIKHSVQYIEFDLDAEAINKQNISIIRSDIFLKNSSDSIEELIEQIRFNKNDEAKELLILKEYYPKIIEIKNNVLNEMDINVKEKPDPSNYDDENILNIILMPNGIIYRYYPFNTLDKSIKKNIIYLDPDHIFCMPYLKNIQSHTDKISQYNYEHLDVYDLFKNQKIIQGYIDFAKKLKEGERRYFYFSENLKTELNINNPHFSLDLHIMRKNSPDLYNLKEEKKSRINLNIYSLYIQKYRDIAILMIGPYVNLYVALDRTVYNEALYGYSPAALISL